MTINILTNNIKDMKSELTNLKTAHDRGLGLLKVYLVQHLYEDDNIYPPGTYVGTLTVEYPADCPPYPFAYFVSPNRGNLPAYDFTTGMDVLGVTYTNNGRTAVYECRIFFGSTKLFECTYLYSTVQPTRIKGNWTEE